MPSNMKCEKCSKTFPVTGFLKHLRDYHSSDPELTITCPSCSIVKRSIASFRKHWYKEHHIRQPSSQSQSKQPHTSPSSSDVCGSESDVPQNLCVDPSAVQVAVSSSVSHSKDTVDLDQSGLSCAPPENPVIQSDFNVVHPEEISAFQVPGTSDGEKCVRDVSDNNINKYQESNFSSISDSTPVDSSDYESSSDEEETVSFVPDTADDKSTQISINTKAADLLVLLLERCSVPISALPEVMSNVENIIIGSLLTFANEVDSSLKKQNLSLASFVDTTRSIASAADVFLNLKSEKQQQKYFTKNLGMVSPHRIQLGQTFKKVRKRKVGSMQVVMVPEELVYVPVTEVVERLLSHPDYAKLAEEGALCQSSPYLDNFLKGDKVKSNKILTDHPDALRFILYYDDMEVCSPLKSKAGKQKLGAFYLLLDNIPLKYRSNLDMIPLVALVNANFIKGKNYGIDAAVQSIISDLQKFENGLVLKSGKKVYGTLIAVIGDNLGQHAIGGFKEGFKAHRACRVCLATEIMSQKMTKEDPSLIRVPEAHDRQCSQVQTTRGKNEKLSTEFGVNRSSALIDLESFHVIDGLPPDAMHDILEGALPLTIKKLLRYLIFEKKKFTLDWVNCAVSDFDYGYSEVNDKPCEIKMTHLMDDASSLHQSAVQVWLLATVLPIIIGPHVDVEDEHFINFLTLLEITKIVFSSEITPWMVTYLKDQIELYLSSFIELYGSLIPKQHHLIHYPRWIRLLGSLLNYLCMRCEAKHKYFKRLVVVLGCYKNIAVSLAKRHQLSQAVAWQKPFIEPFKYGPCVSKLARDVPYQNLLPLGTEKVVETSWLQSKGATIKPQKCFVCIGTSNSLPVFGNVIHVVNEPKVLLICNKVVTKSHNIHFASYEVEVLEELCCYEPGDLILPYVYHVHFAKDKKYIAIKHCASGCIF